MKLDIGIADYPWTGDLTGAHLKGRMPTKPVPLMVVHIKDLMERRKRTQYVRGVPIMVAFDPQAGRIWFFPTPNGEYEFVVPAVKEPEPESVEILRVKKSRIGALAERLKSGVSHGAKAKG